MDTVTVQFFKFTSSKFLSVTVSNSEPPLGSSGSSLENSLKSLSVCGSDSDLDSDSSSFSLDPSGEL